MSPSSPPPIQGWIAHESTLQLTNLGKTASLEPDEVRIKVHTSGINRADLAQVAGFYPPPPGASSVLGLECSGWIVERGAAVSHLPLGQPVCALLSGGGYAQELICPAGQAVPIPDGMDLVTAGALPEIFATAFFNLCMQGQMRAGDRVLIHAGGSGVGTAAIQLCQLIGASCFVTASSESKIAKCRQLKADGGAIRTQNWVDQVKNWSPNGIDIILDPVGGSYFEQNQSLLAADGRTIIIGLMGGAHAKIRLSDLLIKRQKIIGSTLRAQPVAKKTEIMNQLVTEIWPALTTGTIKPVIDRIFPWHQAAEAHAYMASNQSMGKILLDWPENRP